jgi:molybdenum cofactor cytidylyltransferase
MTAAVNAHVAGVVLAAGQSRRMGQAKALLELANATFLEHVIGALREGGCAPLVTVANAGDAVVHAVASAAGSLIVPNPDSRSEQIDSLRLALGVFDTAVDAAVVLPVDHPLVQPATVRALIGCFASSGAPLVVPRFDGVAGHPVLIAKPLFEEVRAVRLAEGLRSLIAAHAAEVCAVDLRDPGILRDVDTPADYRSLEERGWRE